jgi:hypothetical protein
MHNELIFQDAVSGLTEYYPCLMDESLVGEFESCIKYPDSGNNQLDYENVRDQLEKMCRKYEYKIIDDEIKRMP